MDSKSQHYQAGNSSPTGPKFLTKSQGFSVLVAVVVETEKLC